MELETLVEMMRTELINRGHQNGAFGSTKNLVSYMEAEEIMETFNKLYPTEYEVVMGWVNAGCKVHPHEPTKQDVPDWTGFGGI